MTAIRLPDWQRQAACLNHPEPDLFFPEQGRAKAKRARAICADCPVKTECLEYALDEHIVFGIWGGLTRDERATYKRKQTCQATPR